MAFLKVDSPTIQLSAKDIVCVVLISTIILASSLTSASCTMGKVLMNPKKIKSIGFLNIVANFFRTSPQFLIYRDAANLYFSEDMDAEKVDNVIKRWELIVK